MNRQICPSLVLAIVLALVSTAGAQTETTIYSFTGNADGGSPSSSLVMDATGNLYGTTFMGGAHRAGEVFELSPNVAGGWTETVLYSFTGGADGSGPQADVVFDKTGHLYGTTYVGGAANQGVVFELTPTVNGWSENALYSFAGGLDGSNPAAGLVIDPWGNLYGTTRYGGSYDAGTVFQVLRGGAGRWTEKVIHTFDWTTGGDPVGGLVYDRKGDLFGTTYSGGSQGYGAVFEMQYSGNDTWTTNAIYSFTAGGDGAFPFAERLIFDKAGNLYGTTQGGGVGEVGVVFRLSPTITGWSEQALYEFNWMVEGNPVSGLVMDGNGNLYGTCANGNRTTTSGSVFKLAPNGGGNYTESDLYVFAGLHEGPTTAVLLDKRGHLYGTTQDGGTANMGQVYELSK